MIFHCTFVISTSFVDKWEHTAIARCCSYPTGTYKNNRVSKRKLFRLQWSLWKVEIFMAQIYNSERTISGEREAIYSNREYGHYFRSRMHFINFIRRACKLVRTLKTARKLLKTGVIYQDLNAVIIHTLHNISKLIATCICWRLITAAVHYSRKWSP